MRLRLLATGEHKVRPHVRRQATVPRTTPGSKIVGTKIVFFHSDRRERGKCGRSVA